MRIMGQEKHATLGTVEVSNYREELSISPQSQAVLNPRLYHVLSTIFVQLNTNWGLIYSNAFNMLPK